jgi:ABC-type multidrug transport system fused ATPase/permease subunit
MLARLRSWWQKVSKPLVTVIVIVLLVLIIILGSIFNWPWVNLRSVTLYNLLQLLIIPAVLAIGGFWFNQIQKDRELAATEQRALREQKATEQRAALERSIARDNQHEAALQSYIDKMSELLLDKG